MKTLLRTLTSLKYGAFPTLVAALVTLFAYYALSSRGLAQAPTEAAVYGAISLAAAVALDAIVGISIFLLQRNWSKSSERAASAFARKTIGLAQYLEICALIDASSIQSTATNLAKSELLPLRLWIIRNVLPKVLGWVPARRRLRVDNIEGWDVVLAELEALATSLKPSVARRLLGARPAPADIAQAYRRKDVARVASGLRRLRVAVNSANAPSTIGSETEELERARLIHEEEDAALEEALWAEGKQLYLD